MLKPGKSRQKFVTVSKLYSQVGHETISNWLPEQVTSLPLQFLSDVHILVSDPCNT